MNIKELKEVIQKIPDNYEIGVAVTDLGNDLMIAPIKKIQISDRDSFVVIINDTSIDNSN